jgi:hypothetical protein
MADCPYNNYEEGLLPELSPMETLNLKLGFDDPSKGDSFGFGFWSFCIPLWTP